MNLLLVPSATRDIIYFLPLPGVVVVLGVVVVVVVGEFVVELVGMVVVGYGVPFSQGTSAGQLQTYKFGSN